MNNINNINNTSGRSTPCPNCGAITGLGNTVCYTCGCPLTGEINLTDFNKRL